MKYKLFALLLLATGCKALDCSQHCVETHIIESEVIIGPIHHHWTEISGPHCVYLPPDTLVVVDTLKIEKVQ